MQVHFYEPSLTAYRLNNNWVKEQEKVLEKLSLGYRINKAADDPSGLAVSEKLRTQVNGYTQALQNSLDGISLLQTSDGIADALHGMMQRIRVLTIQGSNGVYDSGCREAIQQEIDQIKEAIIGATESINFNTMSLLSNEINPNEDKELQLHTGAHKNNTFKINLVNAKKIALDYLDSIDVSSSALSEEGISKLSEAINKLSEGRGVLGAQQNNLENHIKAIQVAHYTHARSESLIRDADMAYEKMILMRNEILVNAGTSMSAQANVNYKNVLAVLPT
ncbi:flagellin [bacterium]|nr:flagellin [bacterium]